MTTPFTYVSDDRQIMYSISRCALGEYVKWQTVGVERWHFLGWLYDGNVRSLPEAERLTREYVELVAS